MQPLPAVRSVGARYPSERPMNVFCPAIARAARRTFATTAWGLLGLGSSPTLAAEPADDSRAEGLFNAAKQLQNAGQLADACPMFAESQRLAAGVGVTLHLANCYEHTGKPASAWAQFRQAEALARARGDEKRAGLAHVRAQALEAKVNRLTVVITAAAPQDDRRVLVDGAPLPPERWNVSLAVDPGDHVVTLDWPGRAARTLHAHLDATHLAAIVEADEPAPAATAPAPVATLAAPAATPPAPMATPAAPATAASATFSISDRSIAGESAASGPPAALSVTERATPARQSPARLGVELGLLGLGAVGAGFGSFFVVRRSVLASHNCPCNPSLENEAVTAATLSFAVGGAALVSSLVVFLTDPTSKPRTGWMLVPAPLSGGAGALVRANF